MKKLTLRFYLLSALFAALTFVLAFILGAGIILATGIPATGGIANIFVAVFLLIIGVKMVPKFGFGTMTLGLMFLFAVPTVIGGPPGLYKIINGILIGLTADTILLVGRRTKFSFIIAGSAGAVVSILSIYYAMVILGLPGVERLTPIVWPLAGVQAILGAVAAVAATTLYEKRLSKLGPVQRLQADE